MLSSPDNKTNVTIVTFGEKGLTTSGQNTTAERFAAFGRRFLGPRKNDRTPRERWRSLKSGSLIDQLDSEFMPASATIRFFYNSTKGMRH